MLIVEPREGDPKLVALVREADDFEAEGGMVVDGGGRKGKRAEYSCTVCGYGIVVYGRAPSCPMCGETRWEHLERRPFSPLLDDIALPLAPEASDVAPHAPSSPRVEEPIRYLRRVKPAQRSKTTPTEELAQFAFARTESG